ncbi:hypothetical protein SAMN05192561_11323 [Halopenitus malekzadehii]|uniref:DUF7991 domain-containing protein n=1 Tax=Halopenitus malekzadehii TaxID=1267564 RepID=A0A1H6JI24_9EURY|nr:hypothetical protein [Halopenitus malekzadehii]SEH61606.1 hypothetical protein SAMN05192561_11323 [Halopenitus malekzadehii]
MATILDVFLFLVVLGLHTLIAAVMTRFLRIRLDTTWGTAIYVAFLVPVALWISTLVVSGPFGIGIDLGTPAAVFTVMILLPTALGVAIDVLYVVPPDEYELPDSA